MTKPKKELVIEVQCLKPIEDYIYSQMNHTPEWEQAERAFQYVLHSRPYPAPAQENNLLKQIRELHAAAHKEMCKEDADSEHIAFWKGSWLAYNNVAGLVEHMEPVVARIAIKTRDQELWDWCLKNGAVQHGDLIGLPADPFFPLKLIKKIAEMHFESSKE